MSHGGDSERWLVSYADFITLLFILFVVLWMISNTNMEEYKKLADSFKAAFSLGGGGGIFSKIVNPEITTAGGGGDNPFGVPDPIVIEGIPKRPPASVEVAGQLTSMLSQFNLSEIVSIKTTVEGVLITFSEILLFTPGTSMLNEDAYPVLDTIIGMLLSNDNEIKIVGHTDNTPSIDPRYPTNWELSLGRAWVIADYLIQSGVSPERIIVAGRGEYEPIFPNDTPEHRNLNSRADIIILYNIDAGAISGDSPLISPDLSP